MKYRSSWMWSPATIYAMYRSLYNQGERILTQGESILMDTTVIDQALSDLSTQISQLATQVESLEAGTVTQEQIDKVASDINAAAAAVDAIIEDTSEGSGGGTGEGDQPHVDNTLPGEQQPNPEQRRR